MGKEPGNIYISEKMLGVSLPPLPRNNNTNLPKISSNNCSSAHSRRFIYIYICTNIRLCVYNIIMLSNKYFLQIQLTNVRCEINQNTPLLEGLYHSKHTNTRFIIMALLL